MSRLGLGPRSRRWLGGTAALVAMAALTAATPAAAAPGQESILMDDSKLVYGEEAEVNAVLDEIKALGADRLRVSVFWEIVAPDPENRQRPAGDFSDPAAYPSQNWDRYDKLVTQARARGLDVMLNITGPAPKWATGTPSRTDIEKTYRPSPQEFAAFVRAVSRRYDGSYEDEAPAPDQPSPPLLGPDPPERPVLPRVTMWSLWNEPNQSGWLTPQWIRHPRSKHGRWLDFSPQLYRSLWDGGWQALVETGHTGGIVLLGETAPTGLRVQGTTRSMRPLRFLRELFCLSRRYRPYRGSAAKVRNCPTSGSASAFRKRHPGLFAATGFGHHPYGLLDAPHKRSRYSDDVALADLSRLTRALDRIYRRYGTGRRMSIYSTEYGYQTRPPDPTIGVRLGVQSKWLNQAEYLTYRNPRVRAHTQFLLYDDGPLGDFRASDRRHWGSWQSGLRFNDGRAKPAYRTYQLPVWINMRTKRRGKGFRIWGLLRPAENGSAQSYRVQYRRGSRGRFRTIKQATTTNPRGYFRTPFKVKRSGQVRVVWEDHARGRTLASRAVSIRVR